jgi:hypothetical protein
LVEERETALEMLGAMELGEEKRRAMVAAVPSCEQGEEWCGGRD